MMRIAEMQGATGGTLITLFGQKRSFRQANLLEEEMEGGEQDRLSVPPFGISTVRLRVP